MSTIIGAETARWAGLQIDLHSKFRSGNLTPDQLEWWLNLSKTKREAIIEHCKKSKPQPEIAEKFELFADYGVITVPDKFVHWERFSTSCTLTPEILSVYNNTFANKHFPNVRRILKPGEKYHVRAFKQNMALHGSVSLNDCWEFLERKNAIYAGAQGICVIVEVFGNCLHNNVRFLSFDSSFMFGDNHKVLGVRLNSNECFDFEPYLHSDIFPRHGSVLLCFTEAEVARSEPPESISK